MPKTSALHQDVVNSATQLALRTSSDPPRVLLVVASSPSSCSVPKLSAFQPNLSRVQPLAPSQRQSGQPTEVTNGLTLGGSAWLVSTYDIYYVLKALSKYLLHLG